MSEDVLVRLARLEEEYARLRDLLDTERRGHKDAPFLFLEGEHPTRPGTRAVVFGVDDPDSPSDAIGIFPNVNGIAIRRGGTSTAVAIDTMLRDAVAASGASVRVEWGEELVGAVDGHNTMYYAARPIEYARCVLSVAGLRWPPSQFTTSGNIVINTGPVWKQGPVLLAYEYDPRATVVSLGDADTLALFAGAIRRRRAEGG